MHNVTAQASYTSSDESIATVNSTVLVTAEGSSTTVITVEYEGFTKTVNITVK